MRFDYNDEYYKQHDDPNYIPVEELEHRINYGVIGKRRMDTFVSNQYKLKSKKDDPPKSDIGLKWLLQRDGDRTSPAQI